MTTPINPPKSSGNLAVLVLLAGLVGAGSGLVAALFRLALQHAEHWRNTLIAWAQGWPMIGFLTVVFLLAGAAALAAWLVRRFAPQASGSGIPHVEAVVNGELPPASPILLPVKFFGGWLAIGGGLALGREGPCVQMGATIAALIGKKFRCDTADGIALAAAGAGAGLATAFNAPLAGAVFVLEELVRRFDTRIAIAALAASGAAIAVARVLLGEAPDFLLAPIAAPHLGAGFLFFLLGLVAGLVGVAYNRTLVGALAVADRLSRWPVELRAALVGAAVGVIAWFAPGWVGGGDALTQAALAGLAASATVPLIFALRFVLGAGSYAAGTPGGLFAPMLVLGAQLGLLFGSGCHLAWPALEVLPTAFAVVGMAAFFTSVVRAPLTGIILVAELTGNSTLLLPMLIACAAAMTIPTMLGNRPIYDTLKERMLQPDPTGKR